jgi:holo-[acyl-carrier protein] synthase
VSAVLMGVDIVEVDRIVRAARRGGGVFDRRVTTAVERELGPGPAAFSVKESLIKAVGGRPAGFAWHDFEAEPRPPAGWGGSLLTEGAAYAVRGASGRAALHRLRPEGGADVTVAGAARWGTGDGLFVSLAIVYVDGSV